MFLLLFIAGFAGFVAMSALGLHHGGHTAHGHTLHQSSAHGHVHGHGADHAVGHSGQHGHLEIEPQASAALAIGTGLLNYLSPMHLFAYLIGAGATGLLLQNVISGVVLNVCAAVGAIAFDFGVIRPLMGFVMKFAGKPSDGLEGTVSQTATAISSFDERGRGLISLTLDGQIVQLLAQLDDAELHHGTTVHKGDEVVVLEVDPERNRCKVTRDLA